MEKARILVVDDEIIIARDLEARLKNMGYEVVAIAASGAEAIQFAGEYLPDLILMDIVLKGELDGIEAAAEVRKRFSSPVIYVTAYTDDRTLERARITEPFGYIVKPFLEREVKANIEMALYKHRVETRLRRIERWFSHALEGNPEGLILADAQQRVSLLNPVGETITAWPRTMASGRDLMEVLHLVDGKGNPIEMAQVNEGPVVCLGEETWLLDRMGVSVPVDSMTCGVRDEENNLTGTVTVFRDASGKRYGALPALMSDVSLAIAEAANLRGMLQLCVESILRNVNAASVRVWTLDSRRETLLLQAWAGDGTGSDNGAARLRIDAHEVGRIVKSGMPFSSNHLQDLASLHDADWVKQERLVAYAGYPVKVDSQVLGVIAVYSRRFLSPPTLDTLDAVAKTMSVGIQRKRVEEQLRQSQKLEAVGLLAGGIAHDFNNIITIIGGYSELLQSRSDLDDDCRHSIAEIHNAAERAAALTAQLLAFSKQQKLVPVPLNLNEIVAKMEVMLRRIIGEHIEFATCLAQDLPLVLADPGQIEQVLANMSINARDAMPSGGKLTIETAVVELDHDYTLRHVDVKAGSYVMLAMSDTGHGIAPDVLPHIFDPFFTTKVPGSGTGLGLATVYGIVKQSGGHIDVYSELELGTTLKLYFPITDISAIRMKEAAPASTARGTETILVVEDDEALRVLVARALLDMGYQVLTAASGAEALSHAQGHPEDIHLLITDVVLTDIRGSEVAKSMLEMRPHAKVIFMSGYTDDAVVRHGVLQGDCNYLQKPFTASRLAAKVRAALDGQK